MLSGGIEKDQGMKWVNTGEHENEVGHWLEMS